MDKQTIKFYEKEALNLAVVYDSCNGGIADYFNTAFTAEMHILEVGCGTGRDLARLVELGFDAEGVEPCKTFRQHAVKKYPSLKGRISNDHLPELFTIDSDSFNAVLCSAVLMHLPEEQVFDAIYAIRRVLKVDGRLLISVPREDGLSEGKARDADDRLFNRIPPDKWQLIFERLGFTLISRWDSGDSLNKRVRGQRSGVRGSVKGSGFNSCTRAFVESLLGLQGTFPYSFSLLQMKLCAKCDSFT